MTNENTILDLPYYLKLFQTYLGRRMYLVFVLTLFAALAEGVGILMLMPLLQGLGAADDVPDSGVSKFLGDLVSNMGWSNYEVAVIVIITLAFLCKGFLVFGAYGYNAYLKAQLLRDLKGKLFDNYSNMSYQYYTQRDTGHFINIINTQINAMLGAFRSSIQLGVQLITTTIYISLAFVIAWRFGLTALILGLGLMFLFRKLNTYVRHLSRKSSLEAGNLAKFLIQFLHAFKYLTATNQAKHLRTTVMTSIGRLTQYDMHKGIAESFTIAVKEPIAVIFIMAIVLIQLTFFEQPLTPILVSTVLFYRGINSTMAIQASLQNLMSNIGAVEFVNEEFIAQKKYAEPNANIEVPVLNEGIKFENVTFSYSPDSGEVLSNINLSIPVRTSVALVGKSGAGKSTIVDLLTLMLKPQKGQVLIDGLPGDQVQLSSWRKQIGYVSQDTVVFNDTMANNICMGEGDAGNDPKLFKRIQQAAQQAHIAEFIEGLPDGYLTEVGDRGVRLSGGQRQRLFIARELFRKPSLLILDEATSALDSDSERQIQQSIDELKGQITVVIIAHRLSTIRNVDNVYVFDNGKVIESGEYEELRNLDGSYFKKLISMQEL